ncbi:MAG TPA: SPOR domain-containing protein [Candidatus Dormibacteraeota bacterium]|nr:SPOR domain-containing protein [Candidatus Dormibacteraeota bacterium]
MGGRERKKGGGGDRVLESKHVIGLFLLMLVFSGVFFSLGYVMGRSQYETQVRADGDEVIASLKEARRGTLHSGAPGKTGSSSKTSQSDDSAKPSSSDWDFYHANEPAKSDEHLAKLQQSSSRSKVVGDRSASSSSSRNGQFHAPLIPGGAIVLQVAASTKQSDALALAESLQKKHFPAFVLTPGADRFYRVQVGPYADQESANLAKKGLENAGFKAITRR